MHNSVDFFRFGNKYYDVFIESDTGHYLFAEAEPFNWAHMLTCNEYIYENDNITGKPYMIRYDTTSADTDYLQSLEPAPYDVAAHIIGNEIRREAFYNSLNDPDEWGDLVEMFDTMTNAEIFEYMEAC